MHYAYIYIYIHVITSSDLNVEAAVANKKPSAIVNKNKNTKFIGAFRLTLEQQAIHIIKTIVETKQIQNNSGCVITNLLVGA